MRALCAAGLVSLCVTASSADAQPAGANRTCRDLTDSAARLRCYEGDGSFDLRTVLLRELECDRAPRAAELMRLFVRRNAVSSLAFHVAEGINYFALPRPENLGALTAVAVFAHDESGRFPFLRARGASPGAVFGIVTRNGQAAIDAWRLRNSPALLVDESASSMKGATDIGCFWLGRSEPPAAATAGDAGKPPAVEPPAVVDDLFEAGFGPKRR